MHNSKLHPLCNIAVCMAFSSLAFIGSLPFKPIMVFICAFIYSSLILPGHVLRSLRILWKSLPFIFSISVLQLLFRREGATLVRFAYLSITAGGLNWAIIMFMRLASVVLCAHTIAQNSFKDFQVAFSALHLPEEISFMLSFGVQLIPNFSKAIKGFMQSLRLRGIEPKSLSWQNRIKIYRILAISSLADIISNSSKAAIALELRGFRSEGKRSFLHKQKFSPADAFCITGLILFIAYLIVI